MFITPIKEFIKKNHEKILALPPGVPKEHHQWIIFANYIDLFAVATNIGFLIVFTHLQMWFLALNVTVVGCSFAASLLLKIRGGAIYKKCVTLLYIILGTGSCTCTLLCGWGCGFQYYLLALILASFYIPFSSKMRLLFTSLLLFGAFVVTYLISHKLLPFYSISPAWEQLLFLISISGFTFTLVYFPLMDNRASQVVTKTLSTTLAKNAELERLSKLKDDFLANTSHELRTPLHGISGIAESLCNDSIVQSSSFLSSNLKHIISSARRLNNLVNDILDFSKIRHNDLVIHPQPLDIAQISKSVLPNFLSTAQKKGITLVHYFPENLPMVLADEDRLIQILFNLIGNAIKFTDQGTVSIEAKAEGSEITISIRDSGIGMTEQDMTTIFDAFEQANSHKKDYRGGTGLGLSITKKLVELHGGTISVGSVPGKGSNFTVTLPASKVEKTVSAIKNGSHVHNALIVEYSHEILPSIECTLELAPAPRIPINRRTVLAIDDEPINLQIVKNHLEPLGITVITSENGLNTNQLIKTHNPRLVLLDIMMPGINGYEICNNILQIYTVAELPVVFVSAKNRISDLVHGFEAGANDYVLKPFLREELIARVEGQLRQRDAVEAIEENAALKEQLAEQIIEKAHIRQMQERLTQLLHNVNDAIIVCNEDAEIIFANRLLISSLGLSTDEQLIGQTISALLHSESKQKNLMTAKLLPAKATSVLFRHAEGNAVELFVKRLPIVSGEEKLIVFAMNPAIPSKSRAHVSEWIFSELEKNQSRINELEKLSAECITANKRMIEQLRDTRYQKIDPFALANKIMVTSVALWKEATGREKWEFADQSRLWKIHPDEDGWQRTVTLDKYLDFRKMPKFPRWTAVVASAQFVIKAVQKKGYVSDSIGEIEQNVKELETALKDDVAKVEV